jgi:glycosyltransferase involved in cell wall biosynthesis
LIFNLTSMSSQPMVSVCIPSYNGARFIGETIESVLNQSFTMFELVICDDRSNDGTVGIVQRFSDPRIRLVCNSTNLGLAANWNKVLCSGMGKYVKLLCEDDLLHPECLARQVGILEDPLHSRVVLAACNRNVINESNEVVLRPRRLFRPGPIGGRKLIRKCVQRGINLIGEPAVGLFRRDAMKKPQICDPTNPYLADLTLWAELLRHGDAFLDSECLASFRISRQAESARAGLHQAARFRNFARTLRRDSLYRITPLDMALASALSFNWCLLRNIFISMRTSPSQTPRNGRAVQLKGENLIPKPTHERCS